MFRAKKHIILNMKMPDYPQFCFLDRLYRLLFDNSAFLRSGLFLHPLLCCLFRAFGEIHSLARRAVRVFCALVNCRHRRSRPKFRAFGLPSRTKQSAFLFPPLRFYHLFSTYSQNAYISLISIFLPSSRTAVPFHVPCT